MAPFTVRPIQSADIDPAYVLTQLARGGPTLDEWRARVRRVLDDPKGPAAILVAAQPGRGPSGMACLTLSDSDTGSGTDSGAGGPALRFDRLVAFDLVDPERVAYALAAAAFRLAVQRGAARLSSGEDLADPAAVARVLWAPTTALHRVI